MFFENIFFIRGQFIQYLAAITVNLQSFATGVAVCWPSPVLPRLNDTNYTPFPNENVADGSMWIGALISIGTAIGPIPSAYLSDRFGRKTTLLWSALPSIIGWILTTSAKSVTQILFARLVLGLSSGVVFTVGTAYVSEIADDNLRGTLGSFLQVAVAAGMLFAYCVGPYTSFISFSLICGSIPVLFFITFFWMPESPYFLIAKGELEKAKTSLSFLRGKSVAEIDEECTKIKNSVEEELSNSSSYLELFTNSTQRWSLFIGVGLAISFPLSGATTILIYAEPLFMKTTSDIKPEVLAMILGTFQLLSALITPFIYDRMGRKVILIISAVGMTIPLTAFGAYFYVTDNGIVCATCLTWLPTTCLAIYICANCIGFGGIIWVVMSEIFPTNLREKALAICTMVCYIMAFISALTFDDLAFAIKSSGTFWLYASFCALSGLFVVLFVPETRGLSFEEIQYKLKTGLVVKK